MFEEIKNGLKNKKRGRPSAGTPARAGKRSRRDDHPRNSTPPATTRKAEWKPPAGSWEEEIASLDACEDEETGKLMVYLTWKNGHRTQHETGVIYKRCPQKVSKIRSCLIVFQEGNKKVEEGGGRCEGRYAILHTDCLTDASVLRTPHSHH